MDNFSAMARGMANRDKEQKVFDWNKAAELIRDRKPIVASAGLSQDWEYTGGEIYVDGAPVSDGPGFMYLASVWATPEIDLDGDVEPCFKMASEVPDWGSDTWWPESALAILGVQVPAK